MPRHTQHRASPLRFEQSRYKVIGPMRVDENGSWPGTTPGLHCKPVKDAGGYSLAALTVDPGLPVPLHRQLYDRVRTAILQRQLRGGTRLPSTRNIAWELGVSRNTVLTAFEQLTAEGYLEGRVGAGTFVARAIPDDLLSMRNRAAAKPVERRQPRLARRAAALPDTSAICGLRGRRPFESGIPALDLFPTKVWSRLVAKQWGKIASGDLDLLTNTEPAGLPRLREAVARYAGAARGVVCEPSQVIITNGLQHGLEIASRLLIDPGDKVWFEDPGYPAARATLASAGASFAFVPVNDEGIDVRRGTELCPSPRMIYVTPSHQYPLGVTMSACRRLQLLDLARRADAWILEDDYDSEYRFSAHPVHSIHGLDRNERVIYLGTFSKVLFPTLRLGYVIVPPALVDLFIRARLLAGRASPRIDQEVIADFIEEGFLDRHIRRMRSVYRERQEALLDAGRKYLDGLLRMPPSHAGMHVVGWLIGLNDETASRAARKFDIHVNPLSRYCADVRQPDGLIMGYAALNPRQIRTGAETLARALESAGA